jgi:ribosomal protein S18 acetylase RimI-like enzyme
MIRQVKLSDLDRCYEIERAAYDGDEAATRDKIKKRIEQYPQGFLVLESEGVVVGLVNSACTDHVVMSDDNIKELVGHHEDGCALVVMSVAVHPGYQRKGYAGRLLTGFIEHAKVMGKAEIYLMCQQYLIPLYERYGFETLGLSESNHGGLSWYEMRLSLRHND